MSDIKSITTLLKSYPAKKRQIEQLRYELEHPALIGEQELIESLSLGAGPPGEGGLNRGHISNKTMAIALQYQDIAERMNNETITGIMQELRFLEAEVERLERYISLLDERQAAAIRLLYMERKSWSETETEMKISKRTLLSCRKNALNELVAMYSYLDGVKGKENEDSL